MVTHRSLCTPAITGITVVLITLVVLTCLPLHAQAQRPNQLPPIGTFGTGGSSNKSSVGVVTDGFKAFDALKIAERIKLLLKDGPLRENQHLTSDVKLRVIVFGDAFISLQYGLESDAFAELTISVPGMDPLITRIAPASRAQIKIKMPANYGPKPRVASLYIKARTNDNQPANIKIYELAMEKDRAPDIKKAHALRSSAALAINIDGRPRAKGNEPLPLFDPGPVQSPSGVSMTISPLQIIAKTPPPMIFKFTSQSNYSGGRWEFWRIHKWSTTHVWQKKTGAISPEITKSGKWDGTDSQKKNSIGYHYLVLVVWNGGEPNSEWALAQTDSNLRVK